MLFMIAGDFVIDTPQKLKSKLEMVIILLCVDFDIYLHSWTWKTVIFH